VATSGRLPQARPVPVLPPPRSSDDAVAWVAEHLGDLCGEPPRASSIRGGQAAADAALARLDLTGYASRRSTVLPAERRGATRLSPYVRHGLLTLPRLWAAARHAPHKDREKYRDELLWQEYARHVYARLGARTAQDYRVEQPSPPRWPDPWPREMACMAFVRDELETDGWLVNQTRMWVASQWSVRAGHDWREGEDALYRRLLDGSRAANRLGWQWTVGTGSGKPYGFSRWQVEKRAPQLCARCPLSDRCPISDWPEAEVGARVVPPDGLVDGTTDGGPTEAEVTGKPEVVWLTGESLGADDPAVAAHPELPQVFVFDEPLLRRLRLSGMRLVFLAQALAELEVEVRRGDPVTELSGRRLAVTHAPVPGFGRRAAQLDVVARHPWPWLVRPGSGSLRSYSAWRKSHRVR
jgi:deoxyribodipyrimidine photo-lyase